MYGTYRVLTLFYRYKKLHDSFVEKTLKKIK